MSTSIRNHLPGTIEQIVSDKVVSQIVINTAAGPVTSIITTGSVKRMNLKKGDAVFAIIKATESVHRNGIMNFREEVENLFRACPSLRQTLGGYLPEHNRLFHASSSELHQEAGCNLPE